jgi:hypothetical protein
MLTHRPLGEDENGVNPRDCGGKAAKASTTTDDADDDDHDDEMPARAAATIATRRGWRLDVALTEASIFLLVNSIMDELPDLLDYLKKKRAAGSALYLYFHRRRRWSGMAWLGGWMLMERSDVMWRRGAGGKCLAFDTKR